MTILCLRITTKIWFHQQADRRLAHNSGAALYACSTNRLSAIIATLVQLFHLSGRARYLSWPEAGFYGMNALQRCEMHISFDLAVHNR